MNKHLAGQFDACYEVVKRGLPCSKVKLICFVDKLMTLTSVNIKPALFSSLLEQTKTSARSIMQTIHEGERVIACSDALICWLEVLEEKG